MCHCLEIVIGDSACIMVIRHVCVRVCVYVYLLGFVCGMFKSEFLENRTQLNVESLG